MGYNGLGQIGNDTATYQKTPVKIMDNVALPESTPAKAEEAKEVKITIPSFQITINGEKIDNAYAKYPYILYNNITYFPMTYNGARFLGLHTEWSKTNELKITKSLIYSGKNENTKQYSKDSLTYTAKTETGKIHGIMGSGKNTGSRKIRIT